MKHSDALDKLAPALSKAQANIEGASKDKTNPHFRSKYADLASCWDACREALTANGLSVIQATSPADHGITLTTRILHASGQWIEDDGLYLPAVKQDPQGFGSALTYARRYGLCAMVGISPEDDDGNAASKAVKQQPTGHIGPTTETWEAMDEDEQKFLQGIADFVIGKVENGDPESGWSYIEEQKLQAEEKSALWTRFPSKVRTALRNVAEQRKAK